MIRRTAVIVAVALALFLRGEVAAQQLGKFQKSQMPMQARVDMAMGKAFLEKSTKPLDRIREEIIRSGLPALTDYWPSYVDFCKAIYQLKSGQTDEASAELTNTITRLEATKRKDAEQLALLAVLQGFSIKFAKPKEQMALAEKMERNAKAAVEKDENCPRGWYALALYDMHSPKAQGGGQKVEEYCDKALACESPSKPQYEPTWGDIYIYYLLAEYYSAKGEGAKAEEARSKALRATYSPGAQQKKVRPQAREEEVLENTPTREIHK